MITLITAECALQWLDDSGSQSETRMHSLAAHSVATIAGALQTYRSVALGISDCSIIGQEITYAQVAAGTEYTLPLPEASTRHSLVLVFATTNAQRFIPVVIPSPKAVLFTSEPIPTINREHDAILALSTGISNYYASPDGDIATELIAAVYSQEFQ